MSELDDLTELLRAKTVSGKIHWVAQGNPGWLENHDIRLETKQGESYIEVIKYSDAEDEIVLTIRNRDGIVLARRGFGARLNAYDELHEIIEVVRRQSLGVDGALSDLRTRLEAL